MRRILTAIFIVSICLGISQPARGQTEIQVSQPQVDYSFGGTLSIEADISSETPIQTITIFLQPEGQQGQIIEQIAKTSPPSLIYSLDLEQNPLPVFSTVVYWFQIKFENGDIASSQEFSFEYTDNRFPWQTVQTEEFKIFWYQGNDEFGQAIINAAYEGLARLRNQIEVPTAQGVAIYVYASAQEMRDTLKLSGQNAGWIAGHANLESKVVLVSIPPGPSQSLEIKRQIPHELAHVMLYQKLGENYNNLPSWLNEGLASIVELFPNPDYPLLLEKAYEQDLLLHFEDLCNYFPTDANNFLLAYAESASFAWFLQGEFGNSSLESLVEAYANGLECNKGVETVFDKNLLDLERSWRQATFNENPIRASLAGLFPWMLIFLVVLTPSVGLFVVDIILRRRKNS